LRVPLHEPYRLSFGAIEWFDTLVVALRDRTGNEGYGEATVLTGYTDETIEESWQVACTTARDLALDMQPAEQRLAALAATHPFTATAFRTAFEMLGESDWLTVTRPAAVPLVGLLHARDEEAIAQELEALLASGFRTIKVKVGFEVSHDTALVRTVQRLAAGRVRIRIDANQGYTAEQATTFVRALEPDGIELFEQPCAAGDWPSHMKVARMSHLPLMLDESIYGIEDIERAAAQQAAAYIKVKLMKMTTLAALVASIDRIRALGMKPVLGNGVACDLGCWMEACVAARCIDNAGEMNGYLKARSPLLNCPLEFRQGAIQLQPDFRPALDRARIEPLQVEPALHLAIGEGSRQRGSSIHQLARSAQSRNRT
jgi:L-alanine-DL-glutamate epimerase-like enolase superfamily enzyme